MVNVVSSFLTMRANGVAGMFGRDASRYRKENTMHIRRFAALGALVAAIGATGPANAETLVMEPIFQRLDGIGDSSAGDVGFYFPACCADPADGYDGTYLTADEPGETVIYAANPDPGNPISGAVFFNSTNYAITDFYLNVLGPAEEPLDFHVNILKDDPYAVDAVFGDADGDSMIGPATGGIFQSWEVLNDGKNIHFYNGLLLPGERFTDYNLFSDPAGPLTGISASFDGYAVPEPATWAMMIVGFGLMGGVLRGSRNAKRAVAAKA